MRYALPLLYCVSDDIQAKLLGRITDLNSVPKMEWREWGKLELKIESLEEIDKLMRQRPRYRG